MPRGGWSLTGIADNFAAWLKSKPVDVGDTCRRGIRNYLLKGQLETPFNQWDAGNGALMRMLPVALFTLGDDWLMKGCVVAQARLTHNHPLSDAACVVMGRLLHLALSGASKTRLRRELEGFFAEYESFRFDPYQGLATGYVVDTMQTVLHHFFRGTGFRGMPGRDRQPGGGRRHHRRHRRRPGRGLLRPGEHPEAVAEKDEPGGHRRSRPARPAIDRRYRLAPRANNPPQTVHGMTFTRYSPPITMYSPSPFMMLLGSRSLKKKILPRGTCTSQTVKPNSQARSSSEVKETGC